MKQFRLLLVAALFFNTILIAQVETQNKAESRATCCTDHEDSSFIHRFVASVQHKIDDVVAQQTADETVAILGSIATMSGTTTIKQMRLEHKKLQDADLSRSVDTDTTQVAAFCKLAIPLILRMNKLLIAELAEIDKLLLYWRHAEEHWTHYMFHKSPEKFIEEDQFGEAERKVKKLEQMQQRRYDILGKLLVHLSTFSADANPKLQATWLRGLFATLISSLPKQTVPAESASLSVSLEKAASVVLSFPGSFKRVIEPYKIPSWYRRYWLATTGGLSVLLGLSKLGYRHKEKIEGGAHTIYSYAKNAEEKIRSVIEANKKTGEDLTARKAQLIHNYEHTLLSYLLYFIENEEGRRELAREISEHKYKQLPNHELRKKEIPRDERLLKELVSKGQFDQINFNDLGINKERASEFLYKQLVNSTPEEYHAYRVMNIDKKVGTDLELKRLEKQMVYEKDLAVIMKQVEADGGAVNERKLKGLSGLSKDCDVLSTLYKGVSGHEIPSAKTALSAFDQSKLKSFNKDKIAKAAKEVSLEYLQDVVDPLLGQAIAIELKRAADTTENLGEAVNHLDGKWGHAFNLFHNKRKTTAADVVHEIGQFERPGKELLQSVAEGTEIGVLHMRVLDFSGRHWAYRNKLQIMAGIVLVASYMSYRLAGGAYDAFNWWRGTKTYDEARGALAGLIKLFIRYDDAHPTKMNRMDVGRIHYLTHKLELEGHEVPKKYRKEFMEDVRLLQSQSFTPRQKHTIINDVIFNKYTFLKAEALA